jgi:hypothetical protein
MPSDLGCNDFGSTNEEPEAEPGVGSTFPGVTARTAIQPIPAAYPHAEPTDAAAWLAGWLVPLA